MAFPGGSVFLALFGLGHGLVGARNTELVLCTVGAGYDRTRSWTASERASTTMAFWYYREFATLRAFPNGAVGFDGKCCESLRAGEMVVVRPAETATDGLCGLR